MRAAVAIGSLGFALLAAFLAACTQAAATTTSSDETSDPDAGTTDPDAAAAPAATVLPDAAMTTATAGSCHMSYVSIVDPAAPTPTPIVSGGSGVSGPQWEFSSTSTDPSVLVLVSRGTATSVGTFGTQGSCDPFGGFFGSSGSFGSFFPGQPCSVGTQATPTVVSDLRATPHTLILTADQPTMFQITATTPTAIQQIVTVGTGVTVAAPPGVLVQQRGGAAPAVLSADVDRDPAVAPLRAIVGQVHEIAIADAGSTFTVNATASQRCATPTPEIAPGTPMTWSASGGGFAASNVLTAPSNVAMTTFSGSTLRDHGKFYFEAQILVSTGRQGSSLGVGNVPTSPTTSNVASALETDGCTFTPFGNAFCGFEPAQNVRALPFTTGGRVGFAVDLDNGHLFMTSNGAWTPSAVDATVGYAIARATPMTILSTLATGDQVQWALDPASLRLPVPPGYAPGW